MKARQLFNYSILIIAWVWLLPKPATAYVPPGAGLTAVGAFIALVIGIFIAFFGFLWYPIKRLIRRIKGSEITRKEG